MGCGLYGHGSPLIEGRGWRLLSCEYGSRLVLGLPWALPNVGHEPFRASVEGIRAALLLVGGLESCALF
nr:hypothetical protein [Tanacetum cinerariifolium]